MVRSFSAIFLVVTCPLAATALAACGGSPPAGCHYSLSTRGRGLPASGGDVQLQVTAPAGCTWAYAGDAPWLSVHDVPPAPSGNGDGTVIVSAAANTGTRRAGTATIGFQQITIDQAGVDGPGACTFTMFPMTATIGPSGGLSAFAVVPSAPDCGWWVEAHAPDDDWIDEDFHQGIGTGVSTYRVVPGTALPTLPPPRVGRLGLHNSANALVADYTITQTP